MCSSQKLFTVCSDCSSLGKKKAGRGIRVGSRPKLDLSRWTSLRLIALWTAGTGEQKSTRKTNGCMISGSATTSENIATSILSFNFWTRGICQSSHGSRTFGHGSIILVPLNLALLQLSRLSSVTWKVSTGPLMIMRRNMCSYRRTIVTVCLFYRSLSLSLHCRWVTYC